MHTKSATPYGKPPGEDIVSKDGRRVSGLLACSGTTPQVPCPVQVLSRS